MPDPKLRTTSREYFELCTDLYCEVDETGKFVYLNPSWQKQFGWKSENLLGRRFQELLHPDDLERSLKVFAVEQPNGATFVNRFRDGSDRYRYLEWTGYYDKNRKIGFCHSREVTPKIRNEIILNRVLEVQSVYIQANPESREKQAELFNRILECILEVTEADSGFIGEVDRDAEGGLRVHADNGLYQKIRREFASRGQPKRELDFNTLCTRLKESTGSTNYLGLPLSFGGVKIGIIGLGSSTRQFHEHLVSQLSPFIESISTILGAIQVAKRELEVKERFSAVVDHLPVLLTEYDPNLRFVWVNKTFGSLLGFQVDEILNRPVGDSQFIDSADLERGARFMLSGSSDWAEFKLRTRNGDAVDTMWYNVLLSNGNRIGIGLDISDRKVAEAALIQSSKMASLGEMSAGVSHEINNPLAIIQGSSFRAINNLRDESLNIPEVVADLHRIIQNCDRIARIVRGLRAFSRTADHEPFSPTPISVTIEDVFDLARERLKNDDIELRSDIEFSGLVECRSIQIGQVLMNLINNSYDAVYGHPKSWISVRCFEAKDPNWVRIEVGDSGPGIPTQIRARLMEPFFTTKEVGKGTGLGLSISKGIVDSHGGRFFLDENSPTTLFVIELPKIQRLKSDSD